MDYLKQQFVHFKEDDMNNIVNALIKIQSDENVTVNQQKLGNQIKVLKNIKLLWKHPKRSSQSKEQASLESENVLIFQGKDQETNKSDAVETISALFQREIILIDMTGVTSIEDLEGTNEHVGLIGEKLAEAETADPAILFLNLKFSTEDINEQDLLIHAIFKDRIYYDAFTGINIHLDECILAATVSGEADNIFSFSQKLIECDPEFVERNEPQEVAPTGTIADMDVSVDVFKQNCGKFASEFIDFCVHEYVQDRDESRINHFWTMLEKIFKDAADKWIEMRETEKEGCEIFADILRKSFYMSKDDQSFKKITDWIKKSTELEPLLIYTGDDVYNAAVTSDYIMFTIPTKELEDGHRVLEDSDNPAIRILVVQHIIRDDPTFNVKVSKFEDAIQRCFLSDSVRDFIIDEMLPKINFLEKFPRISKDISDCLNARFCPFWQCFICNESCSKFIDFFMPSELIYLKIAEYYVVIFHQMPFERHVSLSLYNSLAYKTLTEKDVIIQESNYPNERLHNFRKMLCNSMKKEDQTDDIYVVVNGVLNSFEPGRHWVLFFGKQLSGIPRHYDRNKFIHCKIERFFIEFVAISGQQ